MHRSVAPHVLAWLALSVTACGVYDPELIEKHARRGSVRMNDDAEPGDAGAFDASGDAEVDAEVDGGRGAVCGNGVVEEGERCDTAIRRGREGACPDGCSGGRGCERNVLEGRDCQARCERMQVIEARPNDGCCPEGADYARDPDCLARCGNDEIEPGERCDPPSTCKQREDCKPADACERAVYSGSPEACDADCAITRIESCESEDGCCPVGCNAQNDSDCGAEVAAFVCGDVHVASDCQSCDCERCGAHVEACLAQDPAGRCSAVLDCAEREKCSGLDCYCGMVSSDSCAEMPPGRCVETITTTAYGVPASVILAQYQNTAYPLGRAMAVLSCRKQQCAAECGL